MLQESDRNYAFLGGVRFPLFQIWQVKLNMLYVCRTFIDKIELNAFREIPLILNIFNTYLTP